MVDAIHDCEESAPVGDCGAADSAVHAEVRTGATWLTGAGAFCTGTATETSGATSSAFFRPNRPHLRRPLASSDCAATPAESGAWAAGAAWATGAAWAVGAHTGASGAAYATGASSWTGACGAGSGSTAAAAWMGVNS